MVKYLKIDLENDFGASICDTKEDVIIGCGYEVDEISFEELIVAVKDIYEIIKIEGEFSIKYLTEDGV